MQRVCSVAAVSQTGRPAFVPSILRGQYQAGEQSTHHNCALTPLTEKGKSKAKPSVQVSGGNDPHLYIIFLYMYVSFNSFLLISNVIMPKH